MLVGFKRIRDHKLRNVHRSRAEGRRWCSQGAWECCKLPQRGLGQSPSRSRIWCILSLQFLVAAVLLIFHFTCISASPLPLSARPKSGALLASPKAGSDVRIGVRWVFSYNTECWSDLDVYLITMEYLPQYSRRKAIVKRSIVTCMSRPCQTVSLHLYISVQRPLVNGRVIRRPTAASSERVIRLATGGARPQGIQQSVTFSFKNSRKIY